MGYGEIIELVQQSIVRFSRGGAKGSGFVIAAAEDSAFIAANAHVTDGARLIDVVVADELMLPGLVVGEDDSYDYAIVWVCCADGLKPLPVAQEGDYDIGDEVGAFGYPLGATRLQATWGRVGEINNEPDDMGWDLKNEPLSTAKGNSGGPVVSRNGKVVGITGGGIPNQPFSWGVSARALQERLPSLIGDFKADEESLPSIRWDDASVDKWSLMTLNSTISWRDFTGCDQRQVIGTACKPNVVLYRDLVRFGQIYGYYCENSLSCINTREKEHYHYYSSPHRLRVKAFTAIEKIEGVRWDVCIHDNTPDHSLMGCVEIEPD